MSEEAERPVHYKMSAIFGGISLCGDALDPGKSYALGGGPQAYPGITCKVCREMIRRFAQTPIPENWK